MNEKRFDYYKNKSTGQEFVINNYGIAEEGTELLSVKEVVNLLNEQHAENQKLREALKNSYINEICENCEYGDYFSTFDGEYTEHDFECTKKHFGNDHWKCDGLKECDDFELEIKVDRND